MALGMLTSTLTVLRSIEEKLATVPTLSQAPMTKKWSEKWRSSFKMVLISLAVGGIELCYSAETAFVSPLLLRLGVPVYLMTLSWMASPLLGFFLVPILGSASDSCTSALGRRRPFILLYSFGIVTGLMLVPYGEKIGLLLGDKGVQALNETGIFWNTTSSNFTQPVQSLESSSNSIGVVFTILGVMILDFCCDACQTPCRTLMIDQTTIGEQAQGLTTFTIVAGLGGAIGYAIGVNDSELPVHIVFGLVLLIFIICCSLTMCSVGEKRLSKTNKCHQYKRIYSSATVDDLPQGTKMGECDSKSLTEKNDRKPEISSVQLTSGTQSTACDTQSTECGTQSTDSLIHPESKSLPVDGEGRVLSLLSDGTNTRGSTPPLSISSSTDSHSTEEPDRPGPATGELNEMKESGSAAPEIDRPGLPVGEMKEPGLSPPEVIDSGLSVEEIPSDEEELDLKDANIRVFLKSIVFMPKHMWILCLTNLFCWMSLVTYSLYFTDYVGQAIYAGNPNSLRGTFLRERYDEGVRMGSLAMVLYSLSCTVYSFFIPKLIESLGTKAVYVCGQLVYTVGMIGLAVTGNTVAAFISSLTTGVMYATLFTLPYILVARYHFHPEISRLHVREGESRQRGLGTDVAIVSSMVFLGQFILSSCIGGVIHAVKSTVVVPAAAAILSFCGAITALNVEYLGQ